MTTVAALKDFRGYERKKEMLKILSLIKYFRSYQNYSNLKKKVFQLSSQPHHLKIQGMGLVVSA